MKISSHLLRKELEIIIRMATEIMAKDLDSETLDLGDFEIYRTAQIKKMLSEINNTTSDEIPF